MNDTHTTFAEVRDRIRAFNAERDWGQYHSPRNLAMALSVEAAELLELYLWASDGGPQPPVASRIPRVAEEAADVALCLINFCDHAGVDLAAAIEAKMAANAKKYPAEQVRGKLQKHSEYSPEEG